MPLITEAFKCSHFRLVHTSTLLVSSTCKYKNVSSPMPSSSKKKSAFWLIFPCSSRGKKICCCLFLSKSRIIQTRYFNGEINCHFSQGFRCCLCFMRCHSWLHAHRSLIWSYFNSCFFYIFFFFWGASFVFYLHSRGLEKTRQLAQDKSFSALENSPATSNVPPKITSVMRLWEIQS